MKMRGEDTQRETKDGRTGDVGLGESTYIGMSDSQTGEPPLMASHTGQSDPPLQVPGGQEAVTAGAHHQALPQLAQPGDGVGVAHQAEQVLEGLGFRHQNGTIGIPSEDNLPSHSRDVERDVQDGHICLLYIFIRLNFLPFLLLFFFVVHIFLHIPLFHLSGTYIFFVLLFSTLHLPFLIHIFYGTPRSDNSDIRHSIRD